MSTYIKTVNFSIIGQLKHYNIKKLEWITNVYVGCLIDFPESVMHLIEFNNEYFKGKINLIPSGHVIGKPKSNDRFKSRELLDMNFIGVYKIKED